LVLSYFSGDRKKSQPITQEEKPVKRSIVGVLIVLTFVAVGIAAAPPLTFTFSDVHANKTAQETDAYAVNNKGVIAGDYVDSASNQHPMILAGKKLTTADRADCNPTPGVSPAFYGINSAGVAAGWCTNTSGVQIGFTYSKGKFTDIKIKGAGNTNANGINDKGAVVGTYTDSTGAQHGFLLVGKKLTTLDPPGVTSLATAYGINNGGVITVYGLSSAGGYLSFTTANKGKTYKAFHGPGEGTTGTVIHDNNNKGDIVGTVFDTAGNRHGVLFHKKKYFSYDDPNGVGSTRGDGLNDTLVMVGRYGSGAFGGVGFRATTKP
jgi:probable HAF family extracellular repeat protein